VLAPPAADLDRRLRAAAGRVLGCDPRSLSLLLVRSGQMSSRVGDAVTAIVLDSVPNPLLVVKAAASGTPGAERLLAELANLELLATADSARLRASVPRLLAARVDDGLELLLLSALAGDASPPASDAALVPYLMRAASWLAEMARALKPSLAPSLDPGIVPSLLVAPFNAYLERFAPGERERRFLERERHRAARIARDGRLLPMYEHGDFCPQNLLVDGEALRVIDWERPFTPRLPAQDLIHLWACLGGGGTGGFTRAFLEDTPLNRAGRAALAALAGETGLKAEDLRPLFVVHWLDYAVEKASLADPTSSMDLVSLGESGADVLALLAEKEDRLCLA
jgi:hypothetical protein